MHRIYCVLWEGAPRKPAISIAATFLVSSWLKVIVDLFTVHRKIPPAPLLPRPETLINFPSINSTFVPPIDGFFIDIRIFGKIHILNEVQRIWNRNDRRRWIFTKISERAKFKFIWKEFWEWFWNDLSKRSGKEDFYENNREGLIVKERSIRYEMPQKRSKVKHNTRGHTFVR